MAPACVATIFDGDNGGSTATGVTSTEIRIAIPNASGSETASSTTVVRALFEYFNQRFELYGRRLVPVFVSGGTNRPEEARAQAAELASRGVFGAVTGFHERNYMVIPTSLSTLANEGIVTVTQGAGSWLSDRVLYDQLHPYLWSVTPSAEDAEANLASFACTSLAGHPASFAGDPQMRNRARRFAVVSSYLRAYPTRFVVDALTACTGTTPAQATAVSTSEQRVVLERFKQDGVTTILCVCDGFGTSLFFQENTVPSYGPEWVVAPYVYGGSQSEGWVQSNRTRSPQLVPMQLDPGPLAQPVQARAWYQALLSTGLFADASRLGSMGSILEYVYPELMVLATGIQGAGPNLTPDTFGSALMAAQFPNPGAGQAPYWQPTAGFGPGDHSLYDNYTVSLWSDDAPARDTSSTAPKGSWCYLGGGTRYSVGSYPADAHDQLMAACR